MIPDDGVHLMASAGDPQTEPGAWSLKFRDHPSIWTWLKYRGRVYCSTWHKPARSDMDGGYVCKGCLATHRTLGGLVIPHEPSPPQYDKCPYCPDPLNTPSYTNSGHPWCGMGVDTDEGMGVY